LEPSIGMLSYQAYYGLNRSSNVCLFPMFGKSDDDVGKTTL